MVFVFFFPSLNFESIPSHTRLVLLNERLAFVLRRVVGFREEHTVISSRFFLGAHAAWLKQSNFEELSVLEVLFVVCCVSRGIDEGICFGPLVCWRLRQILLLVQEQAAYLREKVHQHSSFMIYTCMSGHLFWRRKLFEAPRRIAETNLEELTVGRTEKPRHSDRIIENN